LASEVSAAGLRGHLRALDENTLLALANDAESVYYTARGS
jgi:hypothetical protein